MVERLGGERGAEKMLQPPGHSPDEARIEMSGHILSAEGKGGELGSSGRQLDFKPQALTPSYFCRSLHLSSSFVSIYTTPSTLL